ncbi:MAG: hypothetical protein JNL18_05020 [Planctomycetaceae bacterium]|nr:hypothetical protein [Planctomycetaceae bacterium]
MAKYVRYVLAFICFAASVGCLALWGWSYIVYVRINHQSPINFGSIHFAAFRGSVCIGPMNAPQVGMAWRHEPIVVPKSIHNSAEARFGPSQFGRYRSDYYFPLWYPALVFALAGIASLRLGRRFTLRSAIIATTIVAGLLGMAVIL